MSCCACLFACLVSAPTFAVGFKFVMACPKLIGLVYRDSLVVRLGKKCPEALPGPTWRIPCRRTVCVGCC